MKPEISLKAAVPLLVFALLIPAAASAMPPASTSPKALFSAEQGGHWIISQPAYRSEIQDRAIRYDSSWTEQDRKNLTGLDYVEVLDMAHSDLGSRAVLTDSNVILYNSDWEEQRELDVSGSPDFLVAKQENFHLIDKVREGGETNYYIQEISYNLENFSSKKKLGLDLNIKAVDSFNQSWITLSPAPEGAQLTYYNKSWTQTREQDIELPGRGLYSELTGLQTSINDFWIMSSEENGFGGKIHRLTAEPAYTGTYYEIGLNSTETNSSVVTTEELPWTLPRATVAAIAVAMIGLAVIIALLLLLIGPYRTWKKHLRQEEEQLRDVKESEEEKESSGEDTEGDEEASNSGSEDGAGSEDESGGEESSQEDEDREE